MQKFGRDPRRRNRNIGTERSGHGQNNSLTIPESWTRDRLFHERLINPVALEYIIHGNSLSFLIEPTLPGYCHACTPQDIERVLHLIPPSHLVQIKMIVLRQPKKKERILRPVWGRLRYWSEIEIYSGPAIHLEAQPIKVKTRWERSLTPDQMLELNRLESDGHTITSDKRYYYVENSLDSIRNTQLYRTLPHEVGHYVDYIQSVPELTEENLDEWEQLGKIYDSKPTKDKEYFAHRYASEFYDQQVTLGNLPFARRYNPEILASHGLEPAWFSDKENFNL